MTSKNFCRRLLYVEGVLLAIDLAEMFDTPDALADFLMLPDADQRRILADRASTGELRGVVMACSIGDKKDGGVIRRDMHGSGAI